MEDCFSTIEIYGHNYLQPSFHQGSTDRSTKIVTCICLSVSLIRNMKIKSYDLKIGNNS